jgi:hypothetical protein
MSDAAWERTGEREPRVLHRHPDGRSIRTDSTIPFLTDVTDGTPAVEVRRRRSTFICRECGAKRVEEWPEL